METHNEGEEMFSDNDFILKRSENLLCSLMLKPGKMCQRRFVVQLVSLPALTRKFVTGYAKEIVNLFVGP